MVEDTICRVVSKDYHNKVVFNDEYLCGGYEKYAPEMTDFLDSVMIKTGIMFDTTYSGKAVWGMCDYLKKTILSQMCFLGIPVA